MRVSLRAAIDELEIGRPHARVALRAECAVWGEWDAARLAQAFANVLGNTVSHGATGEEVRVGVRRAEDAAVVEIENAHRDGPIPAEVLATVFEPFRCSAKATGAGLGLGLYIAREIVRGHGGTITMRSDEAGTVVEIALPLGAMGAAGG